MKHEDQYAIEKMMIHGEELDALYVPPSQASPFSYIFIPESPNEIMLLGVIAELLTKAEQI